MMKEGTVGKKSAKQVVTPTKQTLSNKRLILEYKNRNEVELEYSISTMFKTNCGFFFIWEDSSDINLTLDYFQTCRPKI